MTTKPCPKCQKLLSGEGTSRHDRLERSGLSKSVEYHGNRDDEYFYTCRDCGTKFTGDSCGTWPAKN